MRDTLPAITRAWERDLKRSWEAPRTYDKTHISSVLGCALKTFYDRTLATPKEYDPEAQVRMNDGLAQERLILDWLLEYSVAETEAWSPGGLQILNIPKLTKSGRLSKRSYLMVDNGHDSTSPTAVECPELELVGRSDAFLVDRQGDIVVFESKLISDNFGKAIEIAKEEIKAGDRDSLFEWLWHSTPRWIFWSQSICGQIAGYVHLANRKLADILKQPVTRGVIVLKTRSGKFHQVFYDAREYSFLWDLIEKQALEIKNAVASGDLTQLYVNKNAVMCNMCQYRDTCNQKVIGSIQWSTADPAWVEAVATKLAAKATIKEVGDAHDWLKDAADKACAIPNLGETASIKVEIEGLDAVVRYSKRWSQELIHKLSDEEKENGVAVFDYKRLTSEEIEQGYVILKKPRLDGRLSVVDLSKKKGKAKVKSQKAK